MEKEDLIKLKEKLSKLSEAEKQERDLYLRKLSLGELQGPLTGYPSIDKPWLKWYTEENIKSILPENISMYSYMKSKNINNMNRIAINYYGKIVTYEEMFQKIDEIATKLTTLGLKKGDIISICMPSTPETVYIIYAANKLGIICDMIDPRSNPEQMEYYLKENKSKNLILCENYYKIMQDTLKELELSNIILTPITISAPLSMKIGINTLSTIKSIGVKKKSNIMTWNEFMNLDNSETIEKINDEDKALIIHSSGTTSTPKGIVLTNKNVNAIAFQYEQTSLFSKPHTRFLSVIPAFASFGVVASINLPFTLSMENYLVPLVSPKAFYNKLVKEKINFTLTIPGNFKYVASKKKKIDLSNLYGPGAGGYSITSNEEDFINQNLKNNNAPSPMLMGYGASELSSTACLETLECSKPLSSGVPLVKNIISVFIPGTDIECINGEEGEICVTGPTVMKGYINNEEKTKSVLKKHSDGLVWYHTNDIGKIDTEGRVYPIDRIERMIIKGIDGFKIFPQKIEEIISSSKYVDSCAVVAYNDINIGVTPKAYIVLKKEYLENDIEALDDIKKICQEKLSIRAIPTDFEIIESLPYTSMGKIDFKSLESNNKEIEKTKRKIKRR